MESPLPFKNGNILSLSVSDAHWDVVVGTSLLNSQLLPALLQDWLSSGKRQLVMKFEQGDLSLEHLVNFLMPYSRNTGLIVRVPYSPTLQVVITRTV